jgi:hypothetical protein
LLQLIVGATVLCWGAAAGLLELALGSTLAALVALPFVVRSLIPIIAVLAGLVTWGILGWRSRFVWSLDHVALWIEERAPSLRYALVTAIDPRYRGETAESLAPVISSVDTAPFLGTSAKRTLLPALAALIVTSALVIAMPTKWKTGFGTSGLFGIGAAASSVTGNRLEPLGATLTPPAYAHLRTQTLREPASITGLVGSRVVLTGSGSPDGISVALEEIPSEADQNIAVSDSINDDTEQYDAAQSGVTQLPPQDSAMSLSASGYGSDSTGLSGGYTAVSAKAKGRKPSPVRRARPVARPLVVKQLAVTAGGDGWSVAFALSDSNPALLKLVDRQYHRSIIIDPQIDQPPTGRLLLPLRDTTLRVIAGTLALSATFADDIGLDTARFEYIKCSSGTGDEDFKCAGGTFTTKGFHDARSGDFAYEVPFAMLHLSEGDQLSIRAVIWDHNSETGPGKGVTETRTIRIARKSEYEKLNINAAPPSADTAMVTLRMLIMAVEKLDKASPTMEHRMFQDSSVKLGGVGRKFQQTINLIIDEQTGGGQVQIDPLLALARDSMWTAVTDLEVADTHASLSPLYATYNALKKYSTAARYYLRGVIAPPVVNIERVRMQGTDSGATTLRTPRLLSDVDRARYRIDFMTAIAQLQTAPQDALDSFTLLQVETMRKYPDIAHAIAEAVTAIRSKQSPASALARARGLIDGAAAALDTLPKWSGAW